MTVLIVDDEQIQIDGMQKLIRKLYPDIDTLQAKNGREAWVQLEAQDVDVVFTDIRMPVMDGLELLKLWRSKGHAANQAPHFVIFSGYDEFSYAQTALRYGALDYQLKPLDIHGIECMFERVFSSVEKAGAKEPDVEQSNRDQLCDQVHDYLMRHLDEAISLEEIAMRFAYHPNYFSTLLKKKYGVTFSYYLQQLRLDKACEMLRQTDLRVYDIAKQVGIGDEKYFCRIFKKRYDTSPQTYRRLERG